MKALKAKSDDTMAWGIALALLVAAVLLWAPEATGQELHLAAAEPDIPRSSPPLGRPPMVHDVSPVRHSITLSPAVVELRGKPGQSTSQLLNLHNDTPRELRFEMAARDVVVRDGKRVFVAAGETPRGIAATAVFSRKAVTVLPGETATVRVTLTVPPDSPVRAVVILFQSQSEFKEPGKVGLSASLGTLLTFTLSDQVRIEAAPIAVTPQSATANTGFSQRLTNAGAEPVSPQGVVAILSQSGQLVGKAAFRSHRLLPGQQLEFQAEYPAELKPGRYRAFASFQFEGQTITNVAEFTVR